MKKILLTITLLILVIGCTEKVYTFDDLRNIGFEGGDGSSVIESNRFVGTYEYVISEGNAMELTRRYPVLLNVIANGQNIEGINVTDQTRKHYLATTNAS